jgi:hypothetical protein
VVSHPDPIRETLTMTVAEFIPRQVMHLRQLLTGFPLLRR